MAAIPDYVGNALQFDRSSRDTERMHDVQMQRMLQDLTQNAITFQQQQQTLRDQAHQRGQDALRYGDQSTQLSPALAPSDNSFPQPPAPAPGAMANTSPYMGPPPVQAQPMPTPMPGQSSQPMQPPGGAGAPPNLASLPQHSMQFLAQQAPNQRAAALQALLANVQNPNRVNMVRVPAAGPAPAAPTQGPAPAPASGPAPTPNAATGGWQPSPGAGPALGGKPPMAGAAPGGNQLGAPPMGMGSAGGGSGIEPRKMIDPMQETARMIKEQHMIPDEAGRVSLEMQPIWDAQNKVRLEEFVARSKLAADMVHLENDKLREIREESAQKYRQLSLDERIAHDRATENRSSGGMFGTTGDGTGTAGGLTPGGLKLAGAEYRRTGKMPALGFSTTREKLAIINEGANQAISEGEDPAAVPGTQAEFHANSMALTQITKDLTAIIPFHDMLNKNSNILKDLAGKITKTNNQYANKSINWFQNNVTGNADVAEFLAQMHLVRTEAARIITNPRLVGQLTDTAQKDLTDILSGNMSLSQTNAVIDRLNSDADNRVNAMLAKSKGLMNDLGASGKQQGSAASSSPASPPVNAKGWKLMTDKNGNRAYVSPDKKQFEAVQ